MEALKLAVGISTIVVKPRAAVTLETSSMTRSLIQACEQLEIAQEIAREMSKQLVMDKSSW